jgi:propanediol dehydratase small subunit
MSTATHHGRHESQETSPVVERLESADHDKRAMQIAAAQLRVVTDRRLGKQTPEWVKQLAAEKPHSRAS